MPTLKCVYGTEKKITSIVSIKEYSYGESVNTYRVGDLGIDADAIDYLAVFYEGQVDVIIDRRPDDDRQG